MKSLQQQSQNFWVVSKMRFKMKCTVSIIVALSMLAPTFASAHSGGTDSNGCHSGTQAYHCHGSKSDELNWEAMAAGILLLWGLNYLMRDKPDNKQYLTDDEDGATNRFYFLPHTHIDENLNPSVGAKIGIDF